MKGPNFPQLCFNLLSAMFITRADIQAQSLKTAHSANFLLIIATACDSG